MQHCRSRSNDDNGNDIITEDRYYCIQTGIVWYIVMRSPEAQIPNTTMFVTKKKKQMTLSLGVRSDKVAADVMVKGDGDLSGKCN